ncbi:MAG: alpha/beta hydrolase [Candidatus Acidiferrales bacterium]
MLRKFAAILSALLIVGSVYGQQQTQELDPTTKWATIAENEFHVSFNIIYGKANNVDLRLDVITVGPTSVPRPTLLYFHGGGWLEGTKESTLLYGLPYMAHGMNFINVEYRMAPESLAPAAVEDCRCALHWAYDHAKDYGIDTSKIVVSGHSAGGHLALMTGLLKPTDGFDNSCRRLSDEWRLGTIQDVKVAAIVNFFGPTDLPTLLAPPAPKNFAVRWFGSMPDRMEMAKRVSPITYARPGAPPVLTIMGDKDPILPYAQATSLRDALDHAGVPNELYTVVGAGHGSTTPYAWNRQQGLEAQAAVFSFLEKYGILPANQ